MPISRARLQATGLGVLLVVGLLVAVPAPTARADVPPPGNVIASIDNTLDFYGGGALDRPTHASTRTGALMYENRTVTDGLRVVWGGPDRLDYAVEISASTESPLRTGIFTDVGDRPDGSGNPGLDASLPGGSAGHGEVDILDLAADADGTVTRFDIVFLTSATDARAAVFGEIRMNEPEPTSPVLSPSATSLHWPLQELGAAPLPATEELTNVSGAPLKLGRARISHGATKDYRIRADRCSGRTLAPGAACTVAVAYEPRSGGPRNALLVVPVPGRNLAVSLAGRGLIGSSSLVSTDYAGDTEHFHHFWADGNGSVAGSYTFRADGVGHDPMWGFDLTLGGPAEPLATGHHATEDDGDEPYSFGLRIGPTCTLRGSEDVHGFREDVNHQPTYVDVTFHQQCSASGVKHRDIHGRLRWQYRADLKAPARPTALRASGSAVRWTRSRSHDQAGTIVRVVPGSGAGATPGSGWAVSAGAAMSGTLPILASGSYSLVAFSVDRTGNVSAARTLPITR